MSAYWIAIASGSFQHTAGSFPLTAQANFGTSFGLTALNFTSTTANPATAGVLRLAKTDAIDWRNNANGANLPLAINGSDQLTFNGVVISTASVGGTVNTGTVGRLTLYPATGNTVDDVYTQNAFGIDVLIAAQAARSVALEYTIPNPGNAVATATFALLELAQTFTAAQTFSAAVTISATTNQLVLGTTNTTTITSPAPAASRTYTIPDSGGAASFVMTAGAQTIGGVKTFNAGAGAITMSSSTIAMGANKITGLAAGTTAGDALRYEQLFTSGVVTLLGNLAFNPTTAGIVGTTTNDNTAAGNVGQYISATGDATTSASNTFGDLASVSLTAGDWDVSSNVRWILSGATSTNVQTGITSTSGNSATGLNLGDNGAIDAWVSSATTPTQVTQAVPVVRVSLSGTTTYYLKFAAAYTAGGPPEAIGRISARRVR